MLQFASTWNAIRKLLSAWIDCLAPLLTGWRTSQCGGVGLITGTRETFPQEKYRLVSEVDDDEVWILALVHTSLLWPPEERGALAIPLLAFLKRRIDQIHCKNQGEGVILPHAIEQVGHWRPPVGEGKA